MVRSRLVQLHFSKRNLNRTRNYYWMMLSYLLTTLILLYNYNELGNVKEKSCIVLRFYEKTSKKREEIKIKNCFLEKINKIVTGLFQVSNYIGCHIVSSHRSYNIETLNSSIKSNAFTYIQLHILSCTGS